MIIRSERPDDKAQIFQLVAGAFETEAEARLIDALRESGCTYLSLVAVDEDRIVGHILLTAVTLDGENGLTLLGLAPLAVSTIYQGIGIGSRLVTAALDQCKERDTAAVVVLGDPDYYQRFGFGPASVYGIKSVYEVEDRYFMLLELKRGSLADRTGVARYHAAFSEL